MRQSDDFDNEKGGASLVSMALGVSAFVLILLVAVIFLNQNNGNHRNQVETVPESSVSGEESAQGEFISGSTLTSDDLDFWDMYQDESTEETETETMSEEATTVANEKDDKNHIYIEYDDGSSEWVLVNPYLKKNEYDFTNLVSQNNIYKYYADGKQVSYLGVDISKYQEYVDFPTLKKAGVTFVMLRVGSRGYQTGQIQLDEYFMDNIARATEAGLQIGIYFYSQAMNETEAVEEANLVISSLQGYTVNYPIAFDMEFVNNDTARIETLTKDEKTAVALAFLKKIQEAGYTPMLYGNKEWLVKRIDLSKLEEFDVWLAQEADIPDFPYMYTMWQYTKQGKIDGITGYADFNISFIDYSAR